MCVSLLLGTAAAAEHWDAHEDIDYIDKEAETAAAEHRAAQSIDEALLHGTTPTASWPWPARRAASA